MPWDQRSYNIRIMSKREAEAIEIKKVTKRMFGPVSSFEEFLRQTMSVDPSCKEFKLVITGGDEHHLTCLIMSTNVIGAAYEAHVSGSEIMSAKCIRELVNALKTIKLDHHDKGREIPGAGVELRSDPGRGNKE